MIALNAASQTSGLQTFSTINVRLAAGRIVVPDLVVASTDPLGDVTDANEIIFVAEVTSPNDAVSGRVTKMHLYAAARIEWYLLVEPDTRDYRSSRLRLFRLQGDHYVQDSAEHGETLAVDSPLRFAIDTVRLLRP